MAATTMIPGVEHDFGGGREYLVPPLSLGALELLQSRLDALTKESNPLAAQSVATVVDATHAALRRNYPDMTRDHVADLVDVSNMHEVIAKVLDVAGVMRKEAAEAKKRAAMAPAGASSPASPT